MVKTTRLYLIITVLTLILFQGCKEAQSKNSGADMTTLYLPDLNVLFEEYDQLDSTKAYKAFADKMIEANRDLQSSEMFVEAAFLYNQAGLQDAIAPLLHKAIDNGMANPKILSKFQNLKINTKSAVWQRLQKRLDSIQEELQEVAHFSMEMESMNQFWDYFENAKKDTINAKAIFRDFIFEGPRELRDFYVVRYSSLDNMYGQMINGAPNYYTYLKKQFNPDSLNALKSKTTGWMKHFKEMYPQAVFPKVYVVPGILNSGGTATEMGMFVGGDMYGRSETMPTEELNEWQKEVMMKFSDLPGLTIHELMHFQQSYKDSVNTDNVLRGIIEEGVCDFLLELSSGNEIKNNNLTYLETPENKKKILDDLKTELFTDDLSKWLYNGGDIEDRPHDLGYTMGYLITKSYYNNHKDKQQAVYELLNTSDFSKILRESDYAYLLN